MRAASGGPERAAILATAGVFLALGAFILSQGAGGAPAILVAMAVAAGLVVFVRWSGHREEQLRRRLAGRGAWGAPAQSISPRLGRAVLLANPVGIAWVVAGAPPMVVRWQDVTAAQLGHLGESGLRGLIRRFPPFPGGQIDITVAGRGESSFWLTSPSARSFERWSSSCPPARAALEGRPPVARGTPPTRDNGGSPPEPPPASLESLVDEVGIAFLRGAG